MYSELIEKTGITKDQAAIYSTLLEGGHMTARKIAQKIGLKRGLAYKVIDQLIELGLIEKNEKQSKVALFFPTHPAKLKELIKKREEEIATAATTIDSLMGKMVSSFNLISGKPNVQFFEGEAGIKEVLADSLTTEGEILAYSDIEAIMKYIPKINDWYVSQREKAQINKRGIFIDTPGARNLLEGYHTDITQNKVIKLESVPFHTIMQIYDNKISYVTLSDREMIGVIIEDKVITEMHRNIYEFTWKNATLI